jgi:RNA polymerase sigma-70 factor, ECF subfamily
VNFAFRYVQNDTDAHDLAAETFVRLYQQRLRLRPDTHLSAWLFTTLVNQCHNHNRWKRRHPTVLLETNPDSEYKEGPPGQVLASDLPGPDAALQLDETVLAVKQAIDRLPHDLKVVLLLHHYERLSYREIGEIAGCSERGVETRLYRARQRLRRDLAAFHGEASPQPGRSSGVA